MSAFGGSNDGDSATPPRAPSPTPSQKERTEAKQAADREVKAANAAAAVAAGWATGTATNYDLQYTDGEWAGAGGKYEWVDEYGDVAPDVPELEKDLFGEGPPDAVGEHMENIAVSAQIEGPEKLKPIFKVSNTPSSLIPSLPSLIAITYNY